MLCPTPHTFLPSLRPCSLPTHTVLPTHLLPSVCPSIQPHTLPWEGGCPPHTGQAGVNHRGPAPASACSKWQVWIKGSGGGGGHVCTVGSCRGAVSPPDMSVPGMHGSCTGHTGQGVGSCWGQGDLRMTLSLQQAQELYRDALAGGQSSCSLGNLPPGEEAALTLRYVCELPLEPDGATRYLLPAMLRPRYTQIPQNQCGSLQVPQRFLWELPYTLSLSITLQLPHGIDRVLSNCSLTPLSYRAGNQTTAQVSLAQAPPWDRDMELLVHYAEPHKPSAVLEAGLPEVEPGSLMGDPAVMVTLLPSLLEALPGQSLAGEFIFLLDRSGSMACPMDGLDYSAQRIDSAKETLVLLLKSLPLGCYFNIYGFGSWFESFYPQSVGYTQQTMAESLQRVQQLQADLGGTEILAPLQAIYRSPCLDGHPRQLFVFTDGEVRNAQDVIAEVQRHRGAHRCFSFGIREGASMALVKGIARAAGGSAEFITGQDRMQPKALQSLKRALQPAVTGISLSWDLPPGMEAALLGWGPEVIFPGQRCLIYAQLRGQPQDQTYKEMLQFPLQPQDGDRLPIHRLAAKSLLLELEGAVDTGSEGDRRRVLETSLSLGVVCSLTAYVGVDTERGQPVQGLLVRRDSPLTGDLQKNPWRGQGSRHQVRWGEKAQVGGGTWHRGEKRAPEESPLLRLVSLQNADGSWDLDPRGGCPVG
uniref:VWFA domain-containing protein n=1 Tax=Chrysemys picta bellii TaxID=8478 RepID=A0A8C3F5T3_CHRPI